MTTLLETEGMVGGRSGTPLFGPIDLGLAAGAALVVRGANGTGKSTLLRVLAGLLAPMQGRVHAKTALRYLGHHDAVKPALTVAENLGFWRHFHGTSGIEAARRRATSRPDSAVASPSPARSTRRPRSGSSTSPPTAWTRPRSRGSRQPSPATAAPAARSWWRPMRR